jgi:histidinol-phosphate aminotransferase
LVTLERKGQDWWSRAENVRLDLNELVPHLPAGAFDQILASIRPWMFSAYPEVNPVLDRLARSLGVDVGQIVLSNGSDAAIRQVFDVFCDVGDRVVATTPTYGMYSVYAKLLDAEFTPIEYGSDFVLPTALILDLIERSDGRTKLVAIADPNGAIGCEADPDAIVRIIDSASANGAVVLLDEAHVHFHADRWPHRVNEFDNLVLVRSFSKACGLAGLRLGYLLTNPMLRRLIDKARPVVEINSMAAAAAMYLLDHPEVIAGVVEECKRGKEFLAGELCRLGVNVYSGYGNFLLADFGGEEARAAVVRALAERQVRVRSHDGSPLLGRYVRITAAPVNVLRPVVEIIRQVLKGG